jgi:LAS superfamily LD-carboxypeptidase LdcB
MSAVIATKKEPKDAPNLEPHIGAELDDLAALVAEADGAQEVLVFVKPAERAALTNDGAQVPVDNLERLRQAERRAVAAQAEADAREGAARRLNPTLPGVPPPINQNPLVERAEQDAEDAHDAAQEAVDELEAAEKDVLADQLAGEVAAATGSEAEVGVIVDPTPEQVAAAEAERERIAEEARIARKSAQAMETARSDLQDTIRQGRKVLANTRGKVLDSSVRTDLKNVVSAAWTLSRSEVDAENVDLTRKYTKRFERRATKVERAAEQARQAKKEWKAEQERIAREKARVAAEAKAAAEAAAAKAAAAKAVAEAEAAQAASEAAAEAEAEVAAAAAGHPVAPESTLQAELMEEYSRLFAASKNGQLPAEVLAPVGFAPNHQLRLDAAYDLERLNDAFRGRFGHDLNVIGSYRTLERQRVLKAARGFWAAKPGYSNHGWGLAVDLAGDAARWGTTQRQWLVEHAGEYGWRSPDWAQPNARKFEPWHWEYRTDG